MNPFCWDYEGEEEEVVEEVKVMKKYVSRPMESTEAIMPHVYGLAEGAVRAAMESSGVKEV